MRVLSNAELLLVAGGNPPEPEPEEIVVTAKRYEDDGLCIGWSVYGALGQICISESDFYLGAGVGRPGLHVDYEAEGDLSGVDINYTNVVVRIDVGEAVGDTIDNIGDVVNKFETTAESFAKEFVDKYYPNIDGSENRPEL